jgi:predicted membrane protein
VYGSHRKQVEKGEGTDHEELGRMFDEAAAILDGEETTKQKARSEAAASEAQSKPGSQNS